MQVRVDNLPENNKKQGVPEGYWRCGECGVLFEDPSEGVLSPASFRSSQSSLGTHSACISSVCARHEPTLTGISSGSVVPARALLLPRS